MNTINVEILAEMYRVFFFQVFHHIPSRPAAQPETQSSESKSPDFMSRSPKKRYFKIAISMDYINCMSR